MLTSKQRAYLISLSHNIDPIMQIGKAGVGPEAAAALEEAFNNRELVKINVLKTSPDEPDLAADKLYKRTHSEVVKVIGRKVVLYRPFEKDPEIQLPR